MTTLQELTAAWSLCKTEKARAEVEAEMRKLSTDKADYWIASQLPAGATGPRHIMDRSILFRVGAAAEPIWKGMEEGKFTLRTGGIIIARSRDDKLPSTVEKVEAKIKEYMAGTLDVKRPSVKKAVTPKTEKRREQSSAKERNSEFYVAVERLFDQMLVGVPEFAAHTIRSAGRADLLSLTKTWQTIIDRAKASDPEKLSDITKTKRLNTAMRTLILDPPRDGVYSKAVLGKVKSQFRKLARLYHPDVAGSSPELEAKYREVVEAHGSIFALLSTL